MAPLIVFQRLLQGWYFRDFDRDGKQWIFPHITIIPGLQFSLAGIVGKPETFYDIPAVRFAFEVFSYL